MHRKVRRNCWGHILDDLAQAATLLKEYDPILTGWDYTSTSPGQIDNRLRTFFANYYAVTALQARVYLYMGNYEIGTRTGTGDHLLTCKT